MAAIQEEERLEALPKRPVYAEAGSVTVPRFVFSWLAESRDQAWTVADDGMLLAILGMFEQDLPLREWKFAEEDGELVPTVPGGISELRFLEGKNGMRWTARAAGSSANREALRTLAHTR
jgi:hypothetical protein